MDVSDFNLRLNQLERRADDLDRLYQNLKDSTIDHNTRLALIESNLTLLKTIHADINNLKNGVSNLSTNHKILRKRVDIYVGVAIGVCSTLATVFGKPILMALIAIL